MDAAIDDSCVLFTIREEGLHSLSGGQSADSRISISGSFRDDFEA